MISAGGAVCAKERSRTIKRIPLQVGWQQTVEALGLAVEDCLRQARLPSSIAEHEHPIVTAEQWLRFWDACAACVGQDQWIAGVRAYCSTKLFPPELAAIASPDLRSGFLRYAELKSHIAPVEISLQSDGQQTAVYFDWFASQELISPTLEFLAAVRILDVAELVTGERVLPIRVECVTANEVPQRLVDKYIGMPLRKGSRMRLLFSDQDLERPSRANNPLTLRMLDHFFKDFPAPVTPSRTNEVKSCLRRRLPRGQVSIAALAEELGCSSRQLQRDLKAEGTRFQDVLAEVRRELSLHYLARQRYTPKEVAFLLGYSEPSAFHRAFRRWTGETASEYSARTRNSADL